MMPLLRAVSSQILGCLLVTALVVAAVPAVLSAQTASAPVTDVAQAKSVRDEFVKVLQRYPPVVGGVLKLDPTLLSSESYLTPYPALAAYLAEHPEIRRSPTYFFETVRFDYSGSNAAYYNASDRSWNTMIEMGGVFIIVLTVAGAFAWIIRTAVDYRRWGRIARVQAEAHTKLLDRFTGNEELLAYVQSPAGARFLQSSPISLDGGPRTVGSPLSRILWSVQAGAVLAAAGLGLVYVSSRIDPTRADSIYLLAILILSLGVGFVVSAGLSFALSKRLGLVGDKVGTSE